MSETSVNEITTLLSASLFGTEVRLDTGDFGAVFEQMKQQAVAVLPAGLLGALPLSEELRAEWKKHIYRQIFHFQTLTRTEQELLSKLDEAGVCALVLKGTSAARYYPTPQYRTMGDIDLLVKPKDHAQACQLMLDLCAFETTNEGDAKKGRHRTFDKGGIRVEVHRYYAQGCTPAGNAALDRYLFADMVPRRYTPTELVNGLVLIEHIAQHLETGIGLRQMVDWMMYVNAVLNDEMWNKSFRAAAQEVGMEKLAVTVTRMCQLYLGLTEDNITWCKCADEEAARNLMAYVLNSGNFGNKRGSLESSTLSKLPPITKPIALMKYLQAAGKNARPVQEHKFLTPFAWLCQLTHYAKVARKNHLNITKAREMREERKTRRELFEALGVGKRG